MAKTHWFEVKLVDGSSIDQRFLTSLGAKRYCSSLLSEEQRDQLASINFVKIDSDSTVVEDRVLYVRLLDKWHRSV